MRTTRRLRKRVEVTAETPYPFAFEFPRAGLGVSLPAPSCPATWNAMGLGVLDRNVAESPTPEMTAHSPPRVSVSFVPFR